MISMKLLSILKRGFTLARAGLAARDIRAAPDEENRERAKHYLVELLGKARGLPAKVGQMMTLGGEDEELRQTLNDAIPPLPFAQVVEILEKAWGVPYGKVLRSLEKNGKPASLGQVHFGRLKNGREVAVKVRFPDIARSVEAELELFGWMPKVGPVARWGFHLEEYRDVFWRNFSEELDYESEMRHQQRYRELAAPLKDVVVPEVFPDLCRPNVIVQAREDGISLDTAEKMSLPERRSMARATLRHCLYMLFFHGLVHSDPNPGNFAFRRMGREEYALIVYDYGSVLEIPENMKLTLLRIILALQYREPLDPAACLAALGFDPEKLADLRPVLPALLGVLFDPFTTDAPYNMDDWKISERFDNIAGELKWWFRSAAPAKLIFMMRTLYGLTAMLKRLQTPLPWRFILNNLCSEMYPAARRIVIPDLLPASRPAPKFSGVAAYLKVHVIKPGGSEVRLTMPARVAEDLEDVIDPPVKESIVRQGIDLVEIQRRIARSGFLPQEVFELKDPQRHVRVWLE